MYISINWIKDFVDLNGINIEDLINRFTLSVAEVEGIEYKGKDIDGIKTGKILSVENHPNSNKLHLLKVQVGDEILDIVCGAPNVREGMIVPVAVEGAKVGDITISTAKVGGYDSHGMCCSAKEIGISDDHSGLYEFDENTKLGVDIKDILPIEDIVFEVDNKSLTNRPDLWGHYGIAREISALVGRPLKKPEMYLGAGDGDSLDIKVNVDTCYRYTGATMNNITRKNSDMTMQIRLYYTGMRAINLLADVTNYVMLELGQPMHAFDNSLVKTIEVDAVKDETQFETLDSAVRTLPAGTMVIKSNGENVAVAGVMGGKNSEINDDTNSVLIESACFNGSSVRKTALNIGLRTEASARYEKMLDTNLTEIALRRYIYLISTLDNGAKITSKITDIQKYSYPEVKMDITREYIERYAGMPVTDEQIVSVLTSLEYDVTNHGNGKFTVIAPSFRATKDIDCVPALVEEITRVYGYDNIEAKPTMQEVKPVEPNRHVECEYAIKYALASKFNLNEIHSYIWYDSDMNKLLGITPKSYVRIVNSIQKDNDKIRSTMIPTLLKVAYDNKNTYSDFGVFEIGSCVVGLKPDNLVDEHKKLGILLYSASGENRLLSLKEMVDYIAFEMHVNLTIKPIECDDNYMSPVNLYGVYGNNIQIGVIGMVHPKVSGVMDKKATIVVAELDYTLLLQEEVYENKFEVVSKYPTSGMDFSFVVSKDTHYSKIDDVAKNLKSELNYKVSLVDIYAPENTDEKTYTIHFEIYRLDRTMTGEELESFHTMVIDTFAKNNVYLKQ